MLRSWRWGGRWWWCQTLDKDSARSAFPALTCLPHNNLQVCVHSAIRPPTPYPPPSTSGNQESLVQQQQLWVHWLLLLLSWASAPCHPTGAPTRSALKCPPANNPQRMEKAALCWADRTPGVADVEGRGWIVRMKAGTVAAQLFALPAQHKENAQRAERVNTGRWGRLNSTGGCELTRRLDSILPYLVSTISFEKHF